MSDFKNAFRAKAAQRGSAVPTKEQIRALKAKKQAELAAAATAAVADAKARGEKIPDAKDKEEEFKAFQNQMEEQIKEMASKEAEEATEEAEYRAEREKHEQRMRMEGLLALKKRKVGADGAPEDPGVGPSAAASTSSRPDAGAVPAIVLPARKRRAIDVLQETLAISEGDDDDSDDDDGDDDGLVLDWRQKAV